MIYSGGGNHLSSYSSAFTLAEVLVTLGIIGVVSAMTVPSLMQNYQRQSYVTQLHKVYNEFEQALVRYQNDKNAVSISEAGLTTAAEMNDFITKYFKVVQTCSDALTPCYFDGYKTINGGSVNATVGTSHVLASGVSLRLIKSEQGNKLANLMVDINGQKGPNILGRDLFFFALYKNGRVDDYNDETADAPLTKDQRDSSYNNNCMKAGSDAVSGWGCFGKILNDNWQMTY